MNTYRIAGVSINAEILPSSFEPFLCRETNDTPDSTVEITESINIIGARKCTSTPFFTVLTKDNCWILTSVKSMSKIQISSDYRKAVLCAPDGLENKDVELLLRIFVECQMIGKGCLSLHSACIEKDGKAVCFSGTSGIGKSTRAEQWVEHLGFSLLSGDRPGIMIPSKQVCGVPWDGKENLHINKIADLKGIFEIKRSEKTAVYKISSEEAYSFLARQIFVPMWDSILATKAMINLRKLTAAIPAYRLFCGPDEDSARKAYDIIFNNPEKIISEE